MLANIRHKSVTIRKDGTEIRYRRQGTEIRYGTEDKVQKIRHRKYGTEDTVQKIR